MIFSESLGVRRTYAVAPKSEPSAKITSRFRPLDADPSLIGKSLGDPDDPAEDKVIETWPSSAVSKRDRFTLVVSPQVPEASPLAIKVMPLFNVYVLGILLPYAAISFQSGVCVGDTVLYPGF